MNRVPASLAVVMLAASGHPVSPITLRSWVYRGHISRQEGGGYDLREILDYITRRERSTTVDDLITFLRARLDELEVAAKEMLAVYPTPWELSDRGHMAKITADKPNFAIVIQLDQRQARDAAWLGDPIQHVELNNPDFTLADVAAKRQIIDRFEFARDMSTTPDSPATGAATALAEVLLLLALPFAGHPDYREDWKPT